MVAACLRWDVFRCVGSTTQSEVGAQSLQERTNETEKLVPCFGISSVQLYFFIQLLFEPVSQ